MSPLSDFETVKASMRRLTELEILGMDEVVGGEADQIRDATDAPWHRLTPEERQDIRAFCVSLPEPKEGMPA